MKNIQLSTRLALAATVIIATGVLVYAASNPFRNSHQIALMLIVGTWALKFILGSLIDGEKKPVKKATKKKK